MAGGTPGSFRRTLTCSRSDDAADCCGVRDLLARSLTRMRPLRGCSSLLGWEVVLWFQQVWWRLSGAYGVVWCGDSTVDQLSRCHSAEGCVQPYVRALSLRCYVGVRLYAYSRLLYVWCVRWAAFNTSLRRSRSLVLRNCSRAHRARVYLTPARHLVSSGSHRGFGPVALRALIH